MAPPKLSPEQKSARAAERKMALTNQANLDQSGARDPSVVKPQRSGGKVFVACKIGIPWFDLQLCQMIEKSEQTQAGPRLVKEAVRLPGIVRIRGTAYPRGQTPDGFPEKPTMVHGFAVTENVDRDFWAAWVEQQARSAYVINHMIFAAETMDELRGRAQEITVLSGLEPVKPDKDTRIPRPLREEVSKLGTDVESRPNLGAVAG